MPRLKHVAVRGHRHERGDEVVRGGANERAAAEVPRAAGRGSRRNRRVQAPQALEDAQSTYPADDRPRLRLLSIRP